MKLADHTDIIGDCFARVFARREYLAPSAWIERHFPLIDSDAGGRPLFDFDRCPNLRAIADAFADPSIRRVSVGKCAQSGITTLFLGVVAWSMIYEPARWKIMLPTAGKAQTYNQTRFTPSLLACKALENVVDPETRADRIDYDRGSIEWVGSNSVAEAEGTPARCVWIDEYDRCDPTGVAKLEERGKTYTNAKIIETGSWGQCDEGIDARVQLAQRRYRWAVPCPSCRRYHVRAWSFVEWEGSLSAAPGAVRRLARTRCPHPDCNTPITPDRYHWQNSLGVWFAQTQDVSPLRVGPMGEDLPGEILGETPDGDHVAFHLHGLDNGLVGNPVGEVAAKFIERVKVYGYADREWTTDSLGEPFSPRGQRIDQSAIEERAKASTHTRGTCPAGSAVLGLFVDVQQAGLYWLAVAVTPGGTTYAVVDLGYEPFAATGESKSVLIARGLAALRAKTFDAATPMWWKGQRASRVGPMFTAVDTGADAETLYRLAEHDKALVLLKGYGRNRDNKEDPRPWYDKTIARATGSVRLLMLNVNRWKDTLASWITGSATAEAEIPAIALPADIPAEFADHLASEHRVAGQWKLRRDRTPNHYLDLMVYALATLDRLGARTPTPTPTHNSANNSQQSPVAATNTQQPPPATTSAPTSVPTSVPTPARKPGQGVSHAHAFPRYLT